MLLLCSMMLDDVPAPSDASSRRLYSYLSGSDNDDDDEAGRGGRRAQRRRDDWRAPARRGGDDDDEDGMSSPSWVRSESGSESDAAADDGVTRPSDVVARRVVDSAFGVYSRINDSGLPAQSSSSSSSVSFFCCATHCLQHTRAL